MIDNKTKLEGMLNKKIKSIGLEDLHTSYLYDQGNLEIGRMAQMELGNNSAFEMQKMMPLQKQLQAKRPDLMQMDLPLEKIMKMKGNNPKRMELKVNSTDDFPTVSKKIKLMGD